MSEPTATAKSRVRGLVRSRLAGLSARDVAEWSGSICARLRAWEAFQKARTVLLFMPLPGEVDVRPLGHQALQAGACVCLTRADWSTKRLAPVPVDSLESGLMAGRYGILEPPAGTREIPISNLDLVLVPGLAFDTAGHRLGRGAGFYDRFLADPNLRAVTCGVGFEAQLLDNVPIDQWDIPLQAVATERRLVLTSHTPPAAA